MAPPAFRVASTALGISALFDGLFAALLLTHGTDGSEAATASFGAALFVSAALMLLVRRHTERARRRAAALSALATGGTFAMMIALGADYLEGHPGGIGMVVWSMLKLGLFFGVTVAMRRPDVKTFTAP